MAIPENERTRISSTIIQYLTNDGLYQTSSQNRAKYFRSTFANPASPFGTSGTHSTLDVIVDDVVRGITDYYSVSAADVKLGTVTLDSTPITGRSGLATLVNGTIFVTNTTITASSLVLVTAQLTPLTGQLFVVNSPGVGFTITSSILADNGVVGWAIWEMG